MALKDCIKKLGKAVTKADRELLQTWIDQGLTDDEVLQRYDLHIDKTLVDITKRAQDKGAKVTMKRDVLGELRDFGVARVNKIQRELAAVRKKHGELGQEMGEISWVEGEIKHWDNGGPSIDLADDGALMVRLQQMWFIHKAMFKSGEFGYQQIQGNDAWELFDSFREMEARAEVLRTEMFSLFEQEVELVNKLDDMPGQQRNLDDNGEYFQGPKPPPNIREMGETYSTKPWKISTGKGAEGDLYIQRVGPNAGTPHKTRQGPSDVAISFDDNVLLPSYMFYLLQYLQPQMQARSHGTAQQAINKKDIEAVIIGHFQNQVKEDTGDGYGDTSTVSPDGVREEATANYKAIVRQAEEREINVGITKVESAADAAHIMAEIRKNASEGFWAIVLDADNNVIGVVEHGRGTIDGTSVYPSTYAGAVHSIPGAAKVWMAHNHPSGILEVSQADQRITKRISALLNGSGVEVQGHVLLGAGNNEFTLMNRAGDVENMGNPITPARRNKRVKVFTRKIKGQQHGQVIRSPADTEALIRQMGHPEGIVLLNNRHKYLGFLAMTPAEMQQLKNTGGSGRIIKAMAEMNAAAIIVSTKTAEPDAVANMYSFSQVADWRMLDAVYQSPQGQYASMANLGQLTGNANVAEFFQSQIGFTSGLLTGAQTMPLKKGPALDMLNVLRKQPGVTKAEMDWLDVDEWATAKGTVTQQELIDYIRANGIVVEEATAVDQQAYSGQSLPGGTNPRDIFLKMPEIPQDTIIYQLDFEHIDINKNTITDGQADDMITFAATDPAMAGVEMSRLTRADGTIGLTAENVTEVQYDMLVSQMNANSLAIGKEQTTDFKTVDMFDPDAAGKPGLLENYNKSHFAHQNILAWMRTTERTGPNGERILFVEEIQSDWHQKGAKFGYRSGPMAKPLVDLYAEVEKLMQQQLRQQRVFGRLLKKVDMLGFDNRGDALVDIINNYEDWQTRWDVKDPDIIEAGEKWIGLHREHQRMAVVAREANHARIDTVPDAPFKGRGWPKLAMKRIIRMAAEEGFDSVSWTTGEQQNIRNNIATYAQRISYDLHHRALFVEAKAGSGMQDKTFTVEPAQFEEYMTEGPAAALRAEVDAHIAWYEPHFDEEEGRWSIIDGNSEVVRDQAGEIIYASSKENAITVLNSELNYADNLPEITGDQLDSMVGKGAEKFPNFYDRELVNTTKESAKKLDKNAEITSQEIYLTDGAPFTHELRPPRTGDQQLTAWYVVDYHGRQVKGPFAEEAMAAGVAGQDNANTDTVHRLEITEKMRAAALEGQTLFQNKKGAISFDQARRGIIKMTESRDLSTFMHEAGHLYFEIMRNLAEDPTTPQAVKDDFQKMLEYLGVSDANEITREHHEKWAESFEKYLHEGKAPSVALQSSFNAFRRWLTEIWKRMKGDTPDGIILTPEIRDVMDRILASDDQIAVANATQEFSAVFSTAQQMGVSQRVFDVYKANIVKANNEAIEKETIRLMEANNREARVWWRDEKAKVRKEVEQEAFEQQIFQAFSLLANGTKPDGSPTDSAPFKIDKESLLDLLQGSKETLARLPKPWVYTLTNGVDVDVAAKQLGYSDGIALVKALMEMPNMKDWITVRTEERMKSKFPDPLLDGSVSENAVKAIHNERRAAILAAEMRELRKLMREDAAIVSATKKDTKTQATASREANKGTLPKREELALIKQGSRDTIGKMRVMDVRPSVYLNAERRAGRMAFEAAARGDYEKAYLFKRQQVVNHEMYRAAVKAKEEAVKTRNYLTKFNKVKVQQRLGKLGVIDPILAILEGIELQNVSLKEVNRRTALQQLAQQIHEGQIVTPIAEFLYHVETDSKGNEIIVLNEAPFKNWQELTIDELSAMKDIIKQLEHQAKKKLEMPVNGEMIVFEDAATELTQQVLEVHEIVDLGIGQKTGTKRAVQAKDAAIAHWLGPSVMANILDKQGWGATTRLIVVNVRRAIVERLIPMQKKAIGDLNDIYLAFYAKGVLSWKTKELRQLDKKGFAEINGESLSKSDVLSIALQMGNEGNKSALFNGVRIDGKIAYPEDQVNAALAKLDARDWQFVQAVWDNLDSYWPQLSAMEKERRGISPEKVEHIPFTVETSDGQTVTLTGGYYPLAYNYEHSERHEVAIFEDHYRNMGNGVYVSAATRAGATHNRVKNHSMVVQLGMFQIEKHLKEITRDIAIGNEVNFAKNLLNDKAYRAAMKSTGNGVALKELTLWLTDAAVGELPANSVVERGMAYVRVGFTVSKLALNLFTTMLQLTGIFQSVAAIGAVNMTMGAGRVLRNPYTAWTQARDRSAFLRARYGWQEQMFDKDISDAASVISEYGPGLPTTSNRLKTVLARSFFWPIAKFQQIVDVTTWWAGVWKGRNELGLSEEEAVLYADSQVELAQTSGLFSDRSGIERGTLSATTRQSQFIRLWTALISYMQRKGGIAYMKTQQTKDNLTPITAMKYAMDMLLLFTAEGIASSMLYGRWDWDEDDPAELMLSALKETGLSVAAGIPFVREFQTAQYGSGNTPIGGLTNDLFKLYVQSMQGEMDPALRKAFVNSFGTLFHLPASQTNRLLEALIDEDDPELLEYFTGTRD